MDLEQKKNYSFVEGFIKDKRGEEEAEFLLSKALGLGEREVVSLTGAGGKTTLMFRLAHDLQIEGKKVVTTTTTKILEPSLEESQYLFLDSSEEKIKEFISKHIDKYRHITVAYEKLESGKLKGLSSRFIEDLWRLSKIDYLVI